MARIFITGIGGFLGSHLAEWFLERGHEVAGNDTLVGGYMENVPEGAAFHRVDCTDVEAMKTAIGGSDVVYHTAALSYEGASVFAPATITESIYQATSATLAATAAEGVDRFVYCSSMSRYGENELPFREEMEPRPQDPYAASKVAAEELTRVMAECHGFEYVIVVPHNIIGPRQRYDDPFRNVASIFINRMLQGQQPIIYGDGEQKRCFSYVADVVRPLAKLAFREDVCGETINVGPDDEFVSINSLAETIADIIDFDLDPVYVRDRPQEVKLANCSADKARELLGYCPQYTLRDGLVEMVDWIDEQGTREFEYHLDLEIVTDETPETWKNQLI
ncbi:NAD-dependent epimerase/dehydratase family protein [Natrialbaceae archaeon A-chndr2]